MTTYEPVIGLEVHAQLQTESKLFCSCATAFGAEPNTQTCEICLGLPGCLPCLNQKAVELAVRAALGLGCQLHQTSVFSRKNYFYPDLPKGYQITQFDQPLATGGQLEVTLEATTFIANITRIHIEEDAGKLVHDQSVAGTRSCIDFNRGGTPLVEIVGEPDLRSAAAAAAYFKSLRQALRYLQVCDGNMEQGSMRCDANVSIRPVGQKAFGTRVELKNINSFKFVQQAIAFEIDRQTQLLESGEAVQQQTRLWDPDAKQTRLMRSKEQAHDYRYFPEPDLSPLTLSSAFVAKVQQDVPEMPQAKRLRYVNDLHLTPYDAQVLSDDLELAQYFEAAIETSKHPKQVANWILNEVLRDAKNVNLADIALTPANLAELVDLVQSNTLSANMAKGLLAEVLQKGGSPAELAKARGLTQQNDASALLPWVTETLAAHPEAVASYKAGKVAILGFLVGKVMQKSRGKANPKMVNDLLQQKLTE